MARQNWNQSKNIDGYVYQFTDSGELIGKKAVMGALTLYLDFINLFIMLLRLFGQRR